MTSFKMKSIFVLLLIVLNSSLVAAAGLNAQLSFDCKDEAGQTFSVSKPNPAGARTSFYKGKTATYKYCTPTTAGFNTPGRYVSCFDDQYAPSVQMDIVLESGLFGPAGKLSVSYQGKGAPQPIKGACTNGKK